LSPEEKDRLLAQQAATIRDGARKQAELDTRLKGLEEKANAPPPPSVAERQAREKAFFDAPVTNIRDIVREELKETVQPLIDFKEEVKGQGEYERLKSRLKVDPKFSVFLGNPQVERMVDEMMVNNPKDEQHLYGVIAGLRGAMALGDVPTPQGLNLGAAPNAPVDTSIPPHLRPSPPPLPEGKKEGDVKVRDLTENERRLARERGMKPEEYLAWIDEEATDVINSKIGVPEKVKEGAK
jgi:hypothetical protein